MKIPAMKGRFDAEFELGFCITFWEADGREPQTCKPQTSNFKVQNPTGALIKQEDLRGRKIVLQGTFVCPPIRLPSISDKRMWDKRIGARDRN
ncbi:MAG: hypothetical protein C5B50_06825 [Verrucomicrobia bacterium]|nr:MAG: hypothetical protein C5B50_06825 [Verrucomicrobiota bacterium]